MGRVMGGERELMTVSVLYTYVNIFTCHTTEEVAGIMSYLHHPFCSEWVLAPSDVPSSE